MAKYKTKDLLTKTKDELKDRIQLEGIDWCGTRSIYRYLVNGKFETLPLKVFM